VTPLGKPVRRLVQIPDEGLFVVGLTLAGITFRKSRTRTEYILPYGAGYIRAATLMANATVAAKPKRKIRVKRGSRLIK
jgi:hypothetical protein